ncbi:hypothetical protein ACJMK2_023015 [Sinanodonta woodiana]|uniref:Uncharacterized protein n=1 Tax=Sinanodonta woodiana TaxID=1069815 RepID=A0ABD3T2U4_SINWO
MPSIEKGKTMHRVMHAKHCAGEELAQSDAKHWNVLCYSSQSYFLLYVNKPPPPSTMMPAMKNSLSPQPSSNPSSQPISIPSPQPSSIPNAELILGVEFTEHVWMALMQEFNLEKQLL